jgi:long-subunit acyl-CoA synthetase (AMP-forming)
MSAPETLCAAFQEMSALQPDTVALRTPGDAVTVRWRDYAARAAKVAAGLSALGVARGDTVGIMLTNRPEFHIVDAGALHLGAAPFSVYNTLAAEQLSYVFANAGAKVVVTEAQFVPVIKNSGAEVRIVCVEEGVEGTTSLAELESSGAADFDFEAAWKAVEPDDLATIIYTSGTTGPPKGVELTHRNIVSVAHSVRQAYDIRNGDRVLSFLPSAHIADRVAGHYSTILFGAQVTSVADPRQVAAGLPDCRPHVFFAVPRVLQKVKLGIESALANEPENKQKIANWAIKTGIRYIQHTLYNKPVPFGLKIQHAIAEKVVLSKLRHKLGLDECRIAISGAAAIPVANLEFFWGLGVPVYEVWGMSETAGMGTTTRPGQVKLGTVGVAVPGAEVVLAEDGELLIKSGSKLRGYRADPQRTAEALDEGNWVRTGDIGTIDADGFVSIVDRKKELIISSSGKNMSPTNIENAVKAAGSMIGQVVAIGDDRPYVTALVVLDPDAAAGLAKKLGIAEAPSAVAEHQKVKELVAAAVREGNTALARVEQVKRFHIVGTPWEPGGDELTPTLKLRRKPISLKYAHEIDDLYAESPGPHTVNLG